MKERIITGLILAITVGLLTYFTSWSIFSVLLCGVMLFATQEWKSFILFSNPSNKLIYFCIAIFILTTSTLALLFVPPIAYIILISSGIFWLLIPLLLFKSEILIKYINSEYHLASISLLIISSFFIALITLKKADAMWVFILIILVASADSFAYFFGRKLGKHKLAPDISPGKSIEGVIAGFIMTTIIAIFISAFLSISLPQKLGFCLLAMVISLISVAGDLFESLIKRQRNLKDSGNILPGHGGILDRIDGLSAVAPLFVLGLNLLGII